MKLGSITIFILCLLSFQAFSTGTEVYSFEGQAKCFRSSQTYMYHVVSPFPYPEATSDGKLVVSYKGISPYGPRGWKIEMETSPDRWTEVAKTDESSTSWQIESFKLSAETINKVIQDNQIIRFRNSNIYSGTQNCVKIEFVYNDPSAFSCPRGERDFGGRCRPVHGLFSDTKARTASCNGGNYKEFTYRYTPSATEDGKIQFSYNGCDGADTYVQIDTPRGWLSVGQESTTRSCSYAPASFVVPQVYLALGNVHGQLKFKIKVDDRCAAGMGCGTFSSPQADQCFRQVNLQYKY